MSVLGSGRLGFWMTGVALVLLASPWVVFVPDAAFWGSLLTVVVIGSMVATAAVVRRSSSPSLTQLIHGAMAEAAPAQGSVLRVAPRTRGGRTP